jgi:3-methyladenine DNA glycosylase AlkC
MAEKILLKDILFNKTKVAQIARELQHAYPSFKQNEFIQDAVRKFPELELKARISWIADCLKKYLPDDYKDAVAILLKALPSPNNPKLLDDDFGDFIYATYAEFVVKNGCTKEHLQLSLKALYEITQRFSAEDAIRYFLNAFPKETLKELALWTGDAHYHVRRLCSEGTRPNLPWSQKINISISTPISILDKLFSDKTRFVTRSVANHINDLAKKEPELAIKTLTRWQESNKQKSKEMEYITRHALRTLVKQGNLQAMNMLGFSQDLNVSVAEFIVPKQVKMNTTLEFSFTLKSEEDVDLIVDYILYSPNKAGKLNSKKVFKLKKLSLAKNSPVTIAKKHALRDNMTTRKLYKGRHEVELQINGKAYGKESFQLV